MNVATTASSRRLRWTAIVSVTLLLAALGVSFLLRGTANDGAAGKPIPSAPVTQRGKAKAGTSFQPNGALVSLGRQIFFDKNLSEPSGTSCASCHDPARAFSGTNGSNTGLARGSRPGHFAMRNTPSLLYLRFVNRFHYHWEEDMPLPDAFGGFFWDGRADSISSLVRQPLLNPDEMNNQDAAQIARKLAAASYAEDFRSAFPAADGDPVTALASAGTALEAFLLSPAMAPFNSRYDAYVRGEIRLTAIEMHGLAIFKDRQTGNCMHCHKLNDGVRDPARSLFTDYGFEVVGVPRNRLGQTADPTHPDLGLCERKGAVKATSEDRFCGAFRTPSLRNVAVRESFMHNGAFTKLRDVIAFYATRDTEPRRWYPGEVYDDLPKQYHLHINADTVPYVPTREGMARLNEADIDALVAFLESLTDAEYRLAARESDDGDGQRLAERR
jgi:cytochrome c peroxidase